MAIIKSAKKAMRASGRKRVFNIRRKRSMAEALKGIPAVLGKDRKEQDEALRVAYKALDKAAKRGVIKKNTASRKKSRISAQLKKSSVK
ncbi:30S ribosomal protein S20 [Candidatus Kaiserbacteria bacterium CG10_big_fil_rev_8_21_14_0_10_45_20]|uniref:Small ribosomal subunit protein bS20 n=1 Tax=Candidatus Kaiserbacteria bacterium CG10_big_fil_rev_8_21_14_0_10_45_20 TaxID=1974607 RepID=A0A2H0UF85_9BACT|nr:MAG: 30S ribosomal protein S20 [Candidatus Kaiserbacteria bacterium CG10_big_fil_rev_8_21_14_0_10_45_20]